MTHRFALLAACALALTGAAAAEVGEADSDIVWRTYSQVVYPGDSELSCPALKAQMVHVSTDIRMMDKARARVEENMRSAFDLDAYRNGHLMGVHQFTGNGGGEQAFTKARRQIIDSRRVAADRLNHLGNLMLFCKP